MITVFLSCCYDFHQPLIAIMIVIIMIVIIIHHHRSSTITTTINNNVTITRYGGEGAEAMMGFFTELLNVAKQQNLNQVRHLMSWAS